MPSETLQKALAAGDYITSIKRALHRIPELGMEEHKTTALIRAELEAMAIPLQPLGDVGALAILQGRGKGEGPVIALRADIDALPIQETADVPDRSTIPGMMHACGHDCHAAMLLGAAKILASMADSFAGTVKFLFQPAEEGLGGAQYMIKHGALENPKADCILGLHTHGELLVGEIGMRSGPAMASSDAFTATIRGKSGHGAYPHRVGCDPLQGAAAAILGAQSIVTRQIDALDTVVLSICEIHGGTAKNIIPETVSFGGTVRCQSKTVRDSMEDRLRAVVKSAAELYGCTGELEYLYGVPPLANDPQWTKKVWDSAVRALGEEAVKEIAIPAMGSEDYSFYLEHVPGVFARVGGRREGEPPLVFHNGAFAFPEEALPYGTALFVQFVLDMNEPGRKE